MNQYFGKNVRNLGNALKLSASLLMLCAPLQALEFTINADSQNPISPYIYGNNDHNYFDGSGMTFQRQGGNRFTAYNWETNASNAGADWLHSSDSYLSSSTVPGIVMTDFVDAGNSRDQRSVVTLQMAGYVSADRDGAVTETEVAPGDRWLPVHPRKNSDFSLSPDVNDTAVYMDEAVNFLVDRYGSAENGGVLGYLLDNEPKLWAHTHSRMHPEDATYGEVLEKSIALANAVKDVDPTAQIFGGVLFGWGAYNDNWDDLDSEWFIDRFLTDMSQQEQSGGRRILDAIDIHWYPEAQGETDCRILMSTACDQTSELQSEARIQAPRSLWDSTYTETSWIAEWMTRGPIALLPLLQDKINTNYPGTKLSITEWDFGSTEHWSSGLAVTDALGAYGEYGVYAATYWGTLDEFGQAAFKIFRNYNGSGGVYGNTALDASVDDNDAASVYAALNSENPQTLHIIAINKKATQEQAEFDLSSSTTSFLSAEVWGFDEQSSNISLKDSVHGVTGNQFSYSLPPHSVNHFILSTTPSTVYQEFSNHASGIILEGTHSFSVWTEQAGVVKGELINPQGKVLKAGFFNTSGKEKLFLGNWPGSSNEILRISGPALKQTQIYRF